MILKNLCLTALLLFPIACKQTDGTSQSASVADANGTSEQCGLVQKVGEGFFLVSDQGVSRAVEPQDGSTLNVLSDVSSRKEKVCVRADWSGTGIVMIVSSASIRTPVKKTLITEECGVLMTGASGEILLQVVGQNSEQNSNRVIEPQDGASSNILKDYAASMSEVCIKGDFTSKTASVLVNSAAAIRKLR
ncbi:MAG: hypothetical protein RI953_784 [Pseudomonadota bacterium]|jgi:hypothetical protein